MSKPTEETRKRAIQAAEVMLEIVKILVPFSPQMRVAILEFVDTALTEKAK